MRKIFLACFSFMVLLLSSGKAFATDTPVTKESGTNGIYVVMAVCITILAGLILYLISIDRKLTKMEKE